MDTPSPAQPFYAGEFRHSIDEKNRITIPARWRRDGTEEFVILPEANDQFLVVMSPEEFSRMTPRSSPTRMFPRAIGVFSFANYMPAPSTVSADRQGRLFFRRIFAKSGPERRSRAGRRPRPLRNLESAALETCARR